MDQVQVSWSGASMGTGLSVFYFQTGTAATHLPALHDFFAQYAGAAPAGLSIRVPGSGLQMGLDGKVTGQWTGTAPAAIPGTVTGTSYAAGVGARIRWYTGTVVHGHRVVGSTFLLPLAVGNFQTDGSLMDATVNVFQTAANALVTAANGDFGIWTRPTKTGLPGAFSSVSSAACPDRVSWLKTRRT